MRKSSITAGLAVMMGVSTAPFAAQAASFTSISLETPVNVIGLSAAQIQIDLAAGKYSVVDLVTSYQRQINRYNPTYNAFTYLNPNVLQEAAAADAFLLANNGQIPAGQLFFGVPVVVKDSMNVAGVRTTGGYSGFTSENGGVDMIPLVDSPIVQRLKSAGAIILGKTNLPAFARSGSNANSSYLGPTLNAFDITKAPGGSSTGTATAVASGMATIGTAEETGGSIQNPAGAQGLVGIKPTFGLIPTSGGIPLAGSTRDVFGPNALTVTDAANFLTVTAGYDPTDPNSAAAIGKIPVGGYAAGFSTSSLQGKRFGLFGPGFKNTTLSAEAQFLYNNAIAVLQEMGAQVVADPFADFLATTNAPFSSLGASFTALGGSNTPYDLTQWLQTLDPTKSPTSVADFKAVTGIDLLAERGPLLGAFTPANGLANSVTQPNVFQTNLVNQFLAGRATMLTAFQKVLDDYDLDGFFFPQQSRAPGDLFTGSYGSITVSEINLLGTPQVNLPFGSYQSGLPFSVAFLGDVFTEADLLNYAYAFEQKVQFRPTPALVAVPEPGTVSALLALGAASAIVPLRRRKQEQAPTREPAKV